PIIYVLSVVVAIRVGNATATTLLKGTGDHKMLAASNVIMSIVNLGLSIALAPKYGAIGIALGTLIPVGIISIFWIFPVACRRVRLPVARVLSDGVWPALWPMAVMCAFLLISRNVLRASLPLVGAQAIAGGVLYLLVFLWLAVRNTDRKWYWGNVIVLLRRPGISATVPMA
ncbi:MAG: polysaccharide biosynthesis C-terminal domain-containing protein, partial [Blastocatellia bacterium]